MRHLARGIWKLVQTKQKLPMGNSIHLGISENVDLSEIPVFRNFIWGDPSSFKGIFWREKDYNHGRVWWNSNHLRSDFQRGSERPNPLDTVVLGRCWCPPPSPPQHAHGLFPTYSLTNTRGKAMSWPTERDENLLQWSIAAGTKESPFWII